MNLINKKHDWIFTLCIVGVCFLSVFYAKIAWGAIIFSDTNTSNNDYWLTSGSWSGSCYQGTPYGGNGEFKMDNLFVKNIYKITIYACNNSQNAQANLNFTFSGTGFGSVSVSHANNLLPNCGSGFHAIDIFNPTIIDISSSTQLTFNFSSVLYDNTTLATASSSVAQNWSLRRYCTTSTYNTQTLAIDIYGDYLLSDYINFVEPVNNSVIKNFSMWYVDTKIKTLSSDYTVQIMYQKDGYTSIYYDLTGVPNYTNEITRITIPKTGIPNLTDGSYSAAAYLMEYDGQNDYIRASSSISFVVDNINGATSSYDGVDWSALDDDYDINKACEDVATSSGSYFDDFRYGIECGTRKALYWSFYPSKKSMQKIQYSADNIKLQFPFNAYFGLTDIVTDSLATTTNTTGTLKMPFINKTGDYVMIDVLSSSSLPNLIGGTNANLFRNSISWFIYFGVAFAVFMTFKKI